MSPGPFFRRFCELRERGELTAFSELMPYAAFIGIEVEETPSGPEVVLPPRVSNIGNTQIPAVHGGVVAGLLEHAGVMQLLWECEVERFPKIVNITLAYLRPCVAGLEVRAAASVAKQGRSVTTVRVEAWQLDRAKPVAAATAHFLMG